MRLETVLSMLSCKGGDEPEPTLNHLSGTFSSQRIAFLQDTVYLKKVCQELNGNHAYLFHLKCAIDLPPCGAPWATFNHTAKKSINRQLTSNYHDPTVCHIPPLPQFSPHLTFFSPPLCLSLLHLRITLLFPLSTFCDFDVPPLPSVKPEVN
nr:hypothetical transcript [Hymenolepis microstoma]